MRTLVRVVLLMMVLLVASACDQLIPDLDTAITPDVIPEISNVSSSGEYFLTINNAVDEYLPDGTPDVPAGFKWILVTASVTNTTGPTVNVADGALYMVDDKQERYAVETPDKATMPSLVGAVVPAGQGVMGLARFAIPQDSTPVRLEWCLDTACEQKLAIDLPSI